MIQVNLPTKRVIDVRPFKADFGPFLESGETIGSAVVLVSLYTGADLAPEEILFLSPEVTGTVVEQRIRAGVPGVIYEVTIKVTTSDDRELTATALQAVIPDGVPAFDIFIAFPLTTTPYPVNVVEALDSALAIDDLYELQPDIGELDHLLAILSGTLRDQLQMYTNWPAEAIDASLDAIISGELRTVLLSYSMLAEAIDHSMSIQAGGSLRAALLSYTNWPAEAIDHSLGIISGSLV